MAKHKIASISLTVRDRAISCNFRPTGYPVSIHMSQVQATGRPISSYKLSFLGHYF